MSIADSIKDDAFKLDGDAYIHLYKLVLRDDSIIRMSPIKERTWQGDLYEEIPCILKGVGQQTDGKVIRPRFSVVNPEGIFTSGVDQRLLEGASITRYRILASDFDAVEDKSMKREARISRVISVNKSVIVTECRGPLDGAQFRLPFRTFHPPEFPHVRLR